MTRHTSNKREKQTFAVGHLALGYITGKAASKLLNVNVNIPLLFVASIIADVDLLMPSLLEHRGPTHSIILFLAIAFPAILLWKKQAIPYLVAFASHPFVGDYLTASSAAGGVQLFFPLSSTWFSGGSEASFFAYAYVELALLIVFLMLMLTTRDMMTLIKHNSSNLLLVIPVSTALLPVFLRFPFPVPSILIIPHLILLILLALPIFIDLKHLIHRQHRF
jgi:membrane-bound metal-dependent hydrolase YbcI (DUF457 family)